MNLLKKIPIPIAGVGLGLAALGNLLASYHPMLRAMNGLLSGICILLLTLKILFHWDMVKTELQNPILATVFATYSMSIILLSTYLKPILGGFSLFLWYIGIVLQFTIVLYVVYMFFIKEFSITKIFPSFFIPFIGLSVGSVTAPAFEQLALGKILFWVALMCYFGLLPLCVYRTYVFKNMPPPSLPTIAIFTAPGGLLLAGYMNSFPEKNMIFVYFLTALCLTLYLSVLIQMPKLLRREFSPAFASFTFPFVISAIGIKLTGGYFASTGNPIPVLMILIKVMECIAVVGVFYVFFLFIKFLMTK